MELNITGLKCDHCDYRDDEVQFSEYKDSIGKPCPKCGENLLTQTEYEQCLKLYEVTEKLNKAGNILKWLNPFQYWRLLTGDKRETYSLEVKYPNRKTQTNANA